MGSTSGRLPDFVCVGGQRCATSWLFEAIRGHPEVYLPRKEVHFFDHHYGDGLAAYRGLFAPAGAGQRCGEISPDYLTDEEAVDRLAADLPSATRLIVMLRNPVDRAYSHYRLLRCHGGCRNVSGFLEAFERNPRVREMSLFGKYVGRLMERVGAERVRCWTQEDVMGRPGAMVDEVFDWIGVSRGYRAADLGSRHNVSAGAGWQGRLRLPALLAGLDRSPLGPAYRVARRTPAAGRVRAWLQPSSGGGTSGPSEAERLAAWPSFEADVVELERLTGFDLAHWRPGAGEAGRRAAA